MMTILMKGGNEATGITDWPQRGSICRENSLTGFLPS